MEPLNIDDFDPLADPEDADDAPPDDLDDDEGPAAAPASIAVQQAPPVEPPAKPKGKGGRPRKNPPPAAAPQPQSPQPPRAPPAPARLAGPETWPAEAELVWPLLLEWLAAGNDTGIPMGPEVIRIHLRRLSSGYQPGPPVPLSPPIEGEVVAGNPEMLPGDMLREYIIECYHLPIAKYGARYKVDFIWRTGPRIGKMIRSADFYGPDPSEILSLRRAQEMRKQQQPQNGFGGYMPQMGRFGALGTAPGMPQQPPWQQPYGYPQQPAYGYPQPQPYASDPQMQFELERAREREARLQGQLDSVMQALRDGRDPSAAVIAANMNAAASGGSGNTVTEVIAALVQLGVITPPGRAGFGAAAPAAPAPAPVAAPPSPPQPTQPAGPPADPLASVEAAISTFGRLKKMARMVESLTVDTVEATAEPVDDPAAKEDGLDWVAQSTGGKWPDGTDMRFARKKDGTGVNWTGVLFENGFVGQKVMEVGEAVLKPIGEAAQKIMNGTVVQGGGGGEHQNGTSDSNGAVHAEVVSNIPSGAVPAS